MQYQVEGNSIRIWLPITTPTHKVRVKRPVPGYASEPVACCSVPIQKEDYLEWQISYDTDALNEPSVVMEVVLSKPQGVRYGCELVRLILEARNLGILSPQSFSELQDLVNAQMDAGIEETERVRREEDPDAQTIATVHGFVRHYLRVPNYIKMAHGYSVEIKIAHKQKAVGNQAMVYVNIPVSNCFGDEGRALVGRCARRNEKAQYVIGTDNVGLICDTVTAFALASVKHRRDLKNIFEQIPHL